MHRAARLEEDGFRLATVALCAAVAGLLTLLAASSFPGLAAAYATDVLAGVLLVLTVSTALVTTGDAYCHVALSFVLVDSPRGDRRP